MALLYKVNIQTILNGFLTQVGTYDAKRLGKSVESIEKYVAKQKALPLDERDIPPYFEIVDTDAVPDTPEEKLEQKQESYIGMNHNQLLDLCKQRGLEAKGNMSNKALVELLSSADETEIENEETENPYGFKSVEDFEKLDDDEKVEYLDEIFTLPEGIEDGSDEEEDYIKALGEIAEVYGGLSLADEVVEKVKEILDYCES